MNAAKPVKLSPAQQRMVNSASVPNISQQCPGHVAGPGGGGAGYSAWHRTARSLSEKGLLVCLGTYTYCLPGYEDSPRYWDLWHSLSAPQQRRLVGKPSRATAAKLIELGLVETDGTTLTPVGEQVHVRAVNWYSHS